LDKNANSLVNVTKKGFNGTLWKIKKDSLNRLVIAGAFNTYNGVTRNRLIRLDENLEIDNTLSIGTGFNAAARTVLEQTDGKVIVGGEFTTYNGAPSGTYNRIIRLNSDGSVDGGFTIGTGFNALILSLGLQSDGKIICGGQFTTYKGLNGIELTLKHFPSYDNPVYNRELHPVTGKPLESYRMTFVDISTQDGEPNLKKIVRKGREMVMATNFYSDVIWG
jgi:hypothetical protein